MSRDKKLTIGTADGIPYYLPKKPDDPISHIESILEVIENEELSPDPRTWMNLDAAELYFGTQAQKREYRKAVRQAVLRSAE